MFLDLLPKVQNQGTTFESTFYGYNTFGIGLLSLFQSTYQNQDPRNATETMYPAITIIVLCISTFLTITILINLIITLMNDLFQGIKANQEFVFLRNRAGENTLKLGTQEENI